MRPVAFKLTRIPTLRSVEEFRRHRESLGLELPCDDQILVGNSSPLAQPLTQITINGKTIGNRFAVLPMEGWDGTLAGGPSPETLRRWQHFGESGAKLVWGGEAMAVRPEGRSNPNQILIAKGALTTRMICRTVSDCTTAPRHGLISGCYPLDRYYTAKPEFQSLRAIKKKMTG